MQNYSLIIDIFQNFIENIHKTLTKDSSKWLSISFLAIRKNNFDILSVTIVLPFLIKIYIIIIRALSLSMIKK